VVDFAPCGGLVPAVNEARCSNELLEHLEHLHETNDLFGNVAKQGPEGLGSHADSSARPISINLRPD
jgi:hypothetical protein